MAEALLDILGMPAGGEELGRVRVPETFHGDGKALHRARLDVRAGCGGGVEQQVEIARTDGVGAESNEFPVKEEA